VTQGVARRRWCGYAARCVVVRFHCWWVRALWASVCVQRTVLRTGRESIRESGECRDDPRWQTAFRQTNGKARKHTNSLEAWPTAKRPWPPVQHVRLLYAWHQIHAQKRRRGGCAVARLHAHPTTRWARTKRIVRREGEVGAAMSGVGLGVGIAATTTWVVVVTADNRRGAAGWHRRIRAAQDTTWQYSTCSGPQSHLLDVITCAAAKEAACRPPLYRIGSYQCVLGPHHLPMESCMGDTCSECTSDVQCVGLGRDGTIWEYRRRQSEIAVSGRYKSSQRRTMYRRSTVEATADVHEKVSYILGARGDLEYWFRPCLNDASMWTWLTLTCDDSPHTHRDWEAVLSTNSDTSASQDF